MVVIWQEPSSTTRPLLIGRVERWRASASGQREFVVVLRPFIDTPLGLGCFLVDKALLRFLQYQ